MVGQKSCVKHVWIRDDEIRVLLEDFPLVWRCVAVERPEFSFGIDRLQEFSKRSFLVARKRFRWIQEEGAKGCFRVGIFIQNRQKEGKRLAGGRAGDETCVDVVRNGIESLRLMGVQPRQLLFGKDFLKFRIQRGRQRREIAVLRREDDFRRDVASECVFQIIDKILHELTRMG